MVFQREQILEKLKTQIKLNGHIIGVATGAGISAKYAAKGGADLILALNSGRFRQMGLGSIAGLLPFSNCNQMVMEFGSREILPVVKETPVIFGLCATDPTINLESYIDEIIAKGFSGINNYPSIGIIGGQFREALEEEEISYDKEVEAVRIANKKGLFSIAFVFDIEQAKKMVQAGADIICSHLGFTKGGILSGKTPFTLEAAAQITREIFTVCDEMNPQIIKMIYGGPIHEPLDLKYMYDNTGAMGYLGGSSFERIPSEKAITDITREFKITGQFEQDIKLNRLLKGITENYDYVHFIKDYVAKNYMNKISFNDLAIESHISRTYLSVLFNKEVGSTFPEYLTKYRINKAIEIIKSKNVHLTEIATLVGYSDYSHFSKVFKKHTGYSPKEYSLMNKMT
ncbi:MAG: AraC family transcriptional regulator [Firmicutes bacterium HGW-Firmicutes-7]|nr:MAG: AraC family transcriptional regulator [Firmicutes bacterium HGW-Firmicutes-7]